MLSPVEVSLSTSCDHSLAWSSDGELAIAGEEYVQILVSVCCQQRGKCETDVKTRRPKIPLS